MKTWTLDQRGSIAWIADPGERMQRASTAIAVEGGCLVCDPVDTPELDAALEPLGRVLGVCLLLDRHARDADALAARLGAPRIEPRELGSNAAFAGIEAHQLFHARRWNEWALWLPERRLLVVPETLGTLRAFLARPGDRLGMHPLVRLWPPRIALAPFDPETIAVGHGGPVIGQAGIELARTLSRARTDLPRAIASVAGAIVS